MCVFLAVCYAHSTHSLCSYTHRSIDKIYVHDFNRKLYHTFHFNNFPKVRKNRTKTVNIDAKYIYLTACVCASGTVETGFGMQITGFNFNIVKKGKRPFPYKDLYYHILKCVFVWQKKNTEAYAFRERIEKATDKQTLPQIYALTCVYTERELEEERKASLHAHKYRPIYVYAIS